MDPLHRTESRPSRAPDGRASDIRILFLTAEPYPTFRVDVEVLFGRWMPRHGIGSDIVALRNPAAVGEVSWPGGRALLAAPRRGWRRHLHAAWHATRQLLRAKSGDYAAIQVRDIPIIGFAALLVARIKGVPFFYWMSFPIPESHVGMANAMSWRSNPAKRLYHLAVGRLGAVLLYRVVLRQADHVFVQSEQMKADNAARGVPPAHMTPVPMGVDCSAMALTPVAPSTDPRLRDRRVLVYLGTQNRPRQVERLFEMLAIVRREIPEALLVLVGGTGDASHWDWLHRQAAAAGVSDHVLWTGWVPMTQGWGYVRAAEVGLSPFPRGFLLDSASPTKVPEYLALGIPVVCNDNPDQQEIVGATAAGRCVPYTAPDFANAVLELLQLDPHAREAMVAKGRHYIETHRDYRVISERLAATYRAVLGRS